jgi:hypothetical protein
MNLSFFGSVENSQEGGRGVRMKRPLEENAEAGGEKPAKRQLDHVPVRPWKMGQAAQLLNVPHDVLRAHLLCYLPWRDLENLARTCMYVHPDSRHEQEKRALALYPEKTGDLARRAYVYMEQLIPTVHSRPAAETLLPSKKWVKKAFGTSVPIAELRDLRPVQGFKIRLSDVLEIIYRKYQSLLFWPTWNVAYERKQARSKAAALNNAAAIEAQLAQHPKTAGLTWERASALASQSRFHGPVKAFVTENVPCDLATVNSFVAHVAMFVDRSRLEDELAEAAAARGYTVTPQDVAAISQRYFVERMSVEQGVALLHAHLAQKLAAATLEWEKCKQAMGPNAADPK